MELKEIQELIKFVAKSGVSEVEIEDKGFKISIKTPAHAQPLTQVVTVAPQAAQAPVAAVQAAAPVAEAPPAPAPKAEAAANLITVKSPMIGTFYRSAGPDKPVFASVGDEIKKGQIVCIIEAMKLFNEIESEFSGRVVKVLVDDASPVEYDQPLFLVEPA